MFLLLTWVMTLTSVLGIWLAGRKNWMGWAVGVAVQPLWLLFNLMVGAWGLMPMPFIYGWIYAHNLYKWRKADRETVNYIMEG